MAQKNAHARENVAMKIWCHKQIIQFIFDHTN